MALTQRMLTILVAALVLGVVASPAAADVGDTLYSTGGTIDLEIQPATARLDSDLFLLGADGTRGEPLATNRDVGKHVTIGPFPAGQELEFGIFVHGIDQTFLMGTGTRNPDGLAHAKVTQVGGNAYDVGFEDRLNGGDLDYDDNSFRVTLNPPKTGRLTGRGWTYGPEGRVRHRVALDCDAARGGRLTVRGAAGTFRLTHIDYALCLDDPAVGAAGRAGWTTHHGRGTGTLDRVDGYRVEWTLTDGGRGASDSADIVVRDAAGAVVLSEHGPLVGGNHTAHPG